jgi:tetratricopeptide (TPR) repeat protein
MPAAKTLLERSLSLQPPEGVERLSVELELGDALFDLGELGQAEELFSSIASAAGALGDQRLELRALLARSDLRTWTSPEGSLDELRQVAERGISVFGDIGDEVGLSKSWRNLGTVQSFFCRWGDAGRSFQQAFKHAHSAGHYQVAAQTLVGLATALRLGPTPVIEAIERVEAVLAEVGGRPGDEAPRLVDRAILEAWGLAGLEAMRGRFERARELCERARAVFEEVGQTRRLADLSEVRGGVEMLAGNPEEAERQLRLSYEALARMGDRAVLSTVATELAEALLTQGRDDDAARLTKESAELAASDDLESQIRWRTLLARLEVRQGNLENAEALARDALERGSEMEYPNLEAATLAALAEVLELAGHGGDAASVAFCHEVGLDYVSCSPFRMPIARLAAAQAALGKDAVSTA